MKLPAPFGAVFYSKNLGDYHEQYYPQQSHPLDALPFVGKIDQRRRDFWQVHPSGKRGNDFRLGEGFACQYVEYMKEHRQRYLLGWIVRDMIRHQQPSSIELGFMWQLSGVVNPA